MSCDYSCQPNIQLPNKLPQFPVPSDLRRAYLEREDLVCLCPHLGEVRLSGGRVCVYVGGWENSL